MPEDSGSRNKKTCFEPKVRGKLVRNVPALPTFVGIGLSEKDLLLTEISKFYKIMLIINIII